ncbi:MAG: hypothetical protein SH856_01925 [Flavobacteriales bacterium]|nr:hypothetical protein [Flavobacteriales bacterium]
MKLFFRNSFRNLLPAIVILFICKNGSAFISITGDTFHTLECGAPIPLSWLPILENTCGTANTTYLEQWVADDCQDNLIRIWIATNTCGQSDTLFQTIDYVDFTIPVATYVPAGGTLDCSLMESGPADAPTFTDCNSFDLIYSYNDELVSGCNWVRSYTFNAIDVCGNIAIVTWSVIFTDELAPVFDYVPPICENCEVGVITEYPVFHDNCGTNDVVILYEWLPVSPDETWLVWTLTDDCGNSSNAVTVYTHPCIGHEVAIEILTAYPDYNLDIEYTIWNNVTTQVAFGTLVIEGGIASSELMCLEPGCYSIYIGPQGNIQELLWQITVDGIAALTTDDYNTYLNFSVGDGTCNTNGCNNQQACNFNSFDLSNNYCCYNCNTASLTEPSTPSYTNWELWTTDAIPILIGTGTEAFDGIICAELLPFTDYELRMSDPEGDGWDGAQFGISVAQWNWFFSATLEDGAFESIIFTTGGPGCMVPAACNYNSLATIDDGNCLPPGAPIQIIMTDANANGWGNFEYQISDANDSTFHIGKLVGGAYGLEEFCLQTGCYSIQLINPFGGMGGAWQIGWTLQYPNGVAIATGGAPSNTAFGFDISGNQNNDCAVNTGDLLLFMAAYGCSGFCGFPDLNNDLTVNTSDLLLMMGSFGSSY